MKCPDQVQLEAFVDGELPPDAAAVIAGHVAVCGPCAAHVRSVRRLVELLRKQPTGELAEVDVEGLVAALRRRAGEGQVAGSRGAARRPSFRQSLVAASIVVALAAGFAIYQARVAGPGLTPPDAFSLVLLDEHQDYQSALAADPDFSVQVATVGW